MPIGPVASGSQRRRPPRSGRLPTPVSMTSATMTVMLSGPPPTSASWISASAVASGSGLASASAMASADTTPGSPSQQIR